MPRPTCPFCGGSDVADNGLPPSHPDYTLRCSTRVPPGDASIDYAASGAGDRYADARGRVPCGHEWEPNSGGDDS